MTLRIYEKKSIVSFVKLIGKSSILFVSWWTKRSEEGRNSRVG